MTKRQALLVSGPWRPDDARAYHLAAAVLATSCLFSWLLFVNFLAPDELSSADDLAVVTFEADRPSPPPPEPAPSDNVAAGVEAAQTGPAAPQSPTPVPRLAPIIPEASIVFNPTDPILDIPRLDVVPIDRGRGVTTTRGPNRIGGANGEAGDGGGTGGSRGGSGVGGDVRSDLTARWAPSMNSRPFPVKYPDAARLEGIVGIVHLKCFGVGRNRVRDCVVVNEFPSGNGFGNAARDAQNDYRVIVEDQQGKRVRNEWIIIAVEFKPDAK